MQQHAYLYIVITSFVVGVALRSLVDFGFAFILFLVGLGVLLPILSVVIHPEKVVLYVALVILACGLGVLRFDIVAQGDKNHLLKVGDNETLSIEGVVVDEPDEREQSTRLTVRLTSADGTGDLGKALVITERVPRYAYGDVLLLRGDLELPKNFVNENGRTFDYVSYLAKDKIFYTIPFPVIERLDQNRGSLVKSSLFKLKNMFLGSVGMLIPEPHVSLLGGLVVGAKQSLGEKLQDDFRRTGIIHIVVLSGYNVTIVADAITRFFSFFLPKVLSVSFGALSIVFFAIMTGASATIVRASIMALLVILARATGRTYDITRALFIAGFFMVFHNPYIVIFDPSFQLSFLATIGLIYLAPFVERYVACIPSKFQLREFATATIATQLFVLPLLIYMMGEVSLVALPVNLLILALVPLTMFFGFLAGIIGFVSTLLAFPLALVAYVLLAYELAVVNIFASIPFASITVPTLPVWMLLIWYVAYALLLYRLWKGAPAAAILLQKGVSPKLPN